MVEEHTIRTFGLYQLKLNQVWASPIDARNAAAGERFEGHERKRRGIGRWLPEVRFHLSHLDRFRAQMVPVQTSAGYTTESPRI